MGPPWVEGEKIPDDRVREIYKPPPGVPTTFYRSSLVIGSRGVGKTTLFRYQKDVHGEMAIHISLATEFASLTKQTGLGPLTTDFTATMHQLIAGKATALLALSIIGRLQRRNIVAQTDLVVACLPTQFSSAGAVLGPDNISRLTTSVAAEPLKSFDGISARRPLPALVSSLGRMAYQRRGALLLLLDRADMVLTPALEPAFELLDQSDQYVALMAMRPGPAGQALAVLGDTNCRRRPLRHRTSRHPTSI